MVVCKILMICLAVLALNAREFQSHVLKDSAKNCACSPKDKDIYDHDIGDAIISEHQHISDVVSDTNPTFLDIKSESKDKNEIELGYQATDNEEKETSYVDPNKSLNKSLALEIQNNDENKEDLGAETVIIAPGNENEVANNVNQPAKKGTDNDDLNSEHDKQDEDHFDLDDNFLNHAIQDVDIDSENGKIIDLTDKNAKPLDPTIGNLNIMLGHANYAPNYLTPNKKLVDQDIHEVSVIDSASKPILDTASSLHPLSQSSLLTKPTDGPYRIFDNTMLSHGTGTNFINEIPKLVIGNNHNAMPSPVYIKQASSPVLDKWLFEEIKNVGNANVGKLLPHTVELQKIKIQLIKVLEQNGLYFSKNGDLHDVNGDRIKISNLKLRRVMISDPAIYKQHLSGSQCVTPHDIPYLEAVFVSLVYPPKVLGLIPLRMTSLPRCKGGRCAGKKCRDSKTDNPIILNTKIQTKLNLSPIQSTEINEEQQENIPLIDSRAKNEDVNPTPTHIENEVSDAQGEKEVGDKKPSSEHKDDGLGIRIIGGNAATSSGTPVSSRGRSGYTKASWFSI